MKPPTRLRSFLLLVSAATVSTALAQTTYTWNQAAGGAQSWNTDTNWSPIAVPGPVSGDIVDFSTLNILANTTLTLDADRTAELWKFGDTSGSTTWTINAGNKITLAGTTPTIQVNNGTVVLKNEVAGTQGLTKTNGGTLILEATNTFTGNTTISGGTLQIGSNNTTGSTLGNAGTYAGDISIASGAKLIFNTNTSQTLSGVISGDGTLQKGGSGTLILSGANTYTGKTTIAASGAGGPTLSVSSFNSVATNALLGTVHSASSSLGAPTTVADGTIDLGSGSNVRSPTLIYTGSGETTDRVINVSFNSSSKPTLTANTTGGGVLKFTSAFTINPSSGTTSGGLTLRGSGDGEVAAGMTGPALPGYLDKDDVGTWTLGGTTSANSSTVKNGKLIINGALNVTTTVTVNSGATLGGSGTVGGAITINNGGTLSPGSSAGQFTVGNSLALAATSNTLMELGGTTLGSTYDNITIDLTTGTALTYGGNLNVANLGLYDMDLASFTYDLFSLNGVTPTGDFASVTVNSVSLVNSGGLWTGINGSVSYAFDQAVGDLTIVAVPEPAAAALLGLGSLFLLRRRR